MTPRLDGLLIDYVAAGFDPAAFWGLTPRLFDLHMQGAIRRMEREADGRNLQTYNGAALTGAAMAGKLPKFERVFRPRPKAGAVQSAEVLEANLRALARAWGAV